MVSTGYPGENIVYHVGDVMMTIPNSRISQISLLRLDTDYYVSTKVEIETFWPLLSKGGVLIIDDYDYWSGARMAIDEFFEREGITPFLIRMESGRLLIKR